MSTGAGRSGFTSHHPWIPVVMVVILVLIAVPGFRKARQGARQAVLESALRHLAEDQRRYFERHRAYAPRYGMEEKPGIVAAGAPADGEMVIGRADSLGWNATATDSARGVRCAMYVGPDSYAPHPEVTRAGGPFCWTPGAR